MDVTPSRSPSPTSHPPHPRPSLNATSDVSELLIPHETLPIDVPSRIPETNTIHDVIHYWEQGAPEKGLLVPLKDWRTTFEPWKYHTEGQKLSMIKKVYYGFTKQCRGDLNVFSQQFPGLQDQYTKLYLAVRKACLSRGETKTWQQRRVYTSTGA
jgi:hypothetical protein